MDRNTPRNPVSRPHPAAGFTLAEVTIILLVLVILGAILLPMAQRYIELARLAKVSEDVGAIGAAILMFLEDNGLQYFLKNGNGTSGGGAFEDPPDLSLAIGNRVRMLVSDGDIPALGTTGDLLWVTPAPLPGGDYDLLERHLAGNRPGGLLANRYRPPSGAFNGPGWRGAYLSTPVYADPWGNRYAVNVEFLDPKIITMGPAFMFDVVVFSAGPNETVDSPYQADGLLPLLDDIMYPLSGSSQ